jgi:hypothetical protein
MQDSNFISVNGELCYIKRAKIDCASAGDNTVVAAVAGKKIRVLAYVLVVSAAVTVKFMSDVGGTAAALSGAMSLAANSGVGASFVPAGHVEAVAGKALNFYLGGAIQVSGHLVYVEV